LYTINLANGQTAQVGVVDNFPPGLLQIAAANAQAVPEPGTLGLAATGAVLLIFWRRKARA
jgi:hypothetical protein